MTHLRRLWMMVFVAAAMAQAGAARAADPPPLILISIDGFRADYLGRGLSPNLQALAAGGVRAERMTPSFPSITFPNHYTLVTGLYPDHHGVIANGFEDPRVPGPAFTMKAMDEAWWNQALPIWITAERQGVKTGEMFWPGAEVVFGESRPSYVVPYDKTMPENARVDRVLKWLDLPPAERPRFLTLYFEAVDTAGHDFGASSPEVNRAIVKVDAAIGRLVAGLKTRSLAADLVILADHGMSDVPPGHILDLDRLTDPAAAHVVFQGVVLGVNFADTPAGRAARASLLAAHDHLTCWDKADVPARYHYGANPRVPAVVCMTERGWMALTEAQAARRKTPMRGEHGYDIDDPEMGALFIANGPQFRRGLVIPPFPNVDVYPLLTAVLGVKGEPNDGRLADLQPILAR